MTDSSSQPSGRRHRNRLEPIEWAALLHAGVFVVAASWAFGGQAEWVRPALRAWGGLGFLIALSASLRGIARGDRRSGVWLWAIPVGVFNAVVLIASLNPSLHEIRHAGEILLAATGGRPGWPSSARPALAREALLEFDALWITGFNLVLVVRRRRAIRGLLLVVAVNALALAIFGTIQKLLHAPGLFFGAVPSPQSYFFASFVYHNHWGAFMLLSIAVCVGLTVYYSRRTNARDFFHSPAVLGLVVLLILTVSIPLSASRSATVLSVLLLGVAFTHWTLRVVQKRRQFNESIAPPLGAAAVAIILGACSVWYVAHDTIATRVRLTIEQIHFAQHRTAPDSRLQLYTDTVRMALDKPWFGWGMASYPYVFTTYNSRTSVDRLPVFYNDAHSDWLQTFAEHGIIGAAVLSFAVLLPIVALRRRRGDSALSGYLLAGCGVLLVYALLEFPFGNFAVRLTWWVCFYAAIQHALLRRPSDPALPADDGRLGHAQH